MKIQFFFFFSLTKEVLKSPSRGYVFDVTLTAKIMYCTSQAMVSLCVLLQSKKDEDLTLSGSGLSFLEAEKKRGGRTSALNSSSRSIFSQFYFFLTSLFLRVDERFFCLSLAVWRGGWVGEGGGFGLGFGLLGLWLLLVLDQAGEVVGCLCGFFDSGFLSVC